MIIINETYEQGTGKLLKTEEIDIPDNEPTLEDRVLALEAAFSASQIKI